MPSGYKEASSALGLAAIYLTKATNNAIDSMSSTYDISYQTNDYSSQSTNYLKIVNAFLANH